MVDIMPRRWTKNIKQKSLKIPFKMKIDLYIKKISREERLFDACRQLYILDMFLDLYCLILAYMHTTIHRMFKNNYTYMILECKK